MNLAEFGSWGLQQGSVANPPPNNKYKGQCVSLIQQYLYLVFGKPFQPYGNAIDWESNYPQDIFTKLPANTSLQKGDVLVYGSNYGDGYGHIALIDVNMKFYDQNGVKKLAIGYRDVPFIGYVCVLRPKDQNKLGLNTGKTFAVRVDKEKANVRTAPNTSASLVQQPSGRNYLVKGVTFEAVDLVKGEEVDGIDTWYKSAKGNYVWSWGLTRI